MTTLTSNTKVLHHNGLPAFVIVDYNEYLKLHASNPEGKYTRYPHEVVGLNLVQGMSLLKAWRTFLGMTQTELAVTIKSTQNQIANYENGKSIPRADTLIRLSNALGVNAELLWEAED